ncbi:MAG: SMC-Scp complex subunit ScpB [Armatimonadota bacterium]
MDSEIENGNLKSAIECMLFVSTEPVTTAQMASVLEVDEQAVEQAIYDLKLDHGQSGLQIARVAGGFQMCTKPEYSDICQRILIPQNQKLSRAQLETLAVVAYRQPVTQPEVEAIRGVDSNGVMKKLLERGLVKETGRKQTPGRPILYGTTPKFLEHMGLDDLADLPDIDSLAVEKVQELEAQRNLFTDGEITISPESVVQV